MDGVSVRDDGREVGRGCSTRVVDLYGTPGYRSDVERGYEYSETKFEVG